MKISHLLFLLFFLPGSVFGQEAIYDTIRYAREHYQNRIAAFKDQDTKKGGIIFLGNSIVEFGNWDMLLETPVINRGIAGDNTFGVLERLEDVILLEPKKLFIEIGINDISQNIPPDVVAKNILTTVRRVKTKVPNCEIFIHSILPTNENVKNEYPDAYNKKEQTNRVNTLIKKEAIKAGFVYVALDEQVSDSRRQLAAIYAEPDGLHLNQKGYERWVQYLIKKKYLQGFSR